MDFLKTLKVPSPVFPNDSSKIAVINSNASVSDGFKALILNNVLSIPIYDESAHVYIDTLSMLDVVLHALANLNDAEIESMSSAISCLSDKEHFRNFKARDIAGKSRNIPSVTCSSDAFVSDVVELMVKTKAHHVLGLNDKASLANIITQSRVVECISQLFGVDPALTQLGSKTVGELQLGIQKVLSVSKKERASAAFRLMAENNVSGVAVVSEDGGSPTQTLVGSLSVRDLRVIGSNASFIKMLSLPVSEFLQAARASTTDKPQTIVSCTEDTTYKEVVERVVENRVHRCFVVNKSNQLVGVISLWDILHRLTSFSRVQQHP